MKTSFAAIDDLVAKARASTLTANQLITIDGKVMAVAFMANAQHLVYRADVLEKIGMEPPKTYEDMLAAAQKIREMGLMQNPVGGAYAGGLEPSATEFIQYVYRVTAETSSKNGSAEVAINNAQGVATLNMMKALSEYMNPDFLTHDSNATNAEFRAGNVALMNMWGSRAATLVEAEGVDPSVKDGFAIAGPMTVGGGNTNATTLWWDGLALWRKNISDAEAEATFIAMAHAIRPEILNDTTSTQAVWLIDGYQPTPAAIGVFAAATSRLNALSYRCRNNHLLHSASGRRAWLTLCKAKKALNRR